MAIKGTGTSMSPKMTQITMSFFDALRAILNGQHVTRLEWNDRSVYCLLYDGYLSIYKEAGMHALLVRESDMRATDWVATNIVASD